MTSTTESLRTLGNGTNEEGGLIDDSDLVANPEPTDGSKKSLALISSKWVIVLGIGGFVAIASIVFILPFAKLITGGGQEEAQQEESSELSTMLEERDQARSEADRANARLLFEQQQRRPLSATEETPAGDDNEAPEPTGSAVPPGAAPVPQPVAVRPTPPRPTPVARTPAPQQPVVPPPDPEATWATLQTHSIAFAPVATEDPESVRLSAAVEEPAGTTREPSPEEIAIASGVSLAEVAPPEPEETTVPELQVAPGTIARGKQAIPATWNAATERAGGIAAIRLDEPLMDAQGAIVLPEDAVLMTEVVAVAANGWVTQRAIAARWTDAESGEVRQVPLPAGALSIRGEKGDPLIAEITNDSRRAERRNRRNRALLGAVASVGEELTRDETSSSTTSSGLGGFSSSSTISSGDRNVFGAVLEGAGGTLLEDSGRRSDRRDREPIYSVPENTAVEVVVEVPFSLPIAERIAISSQ